MGSRLKSTAMVHITRFLTRLCRIIIATMLKKNLVQLDSAKEQCFVSMYVLPGMLSVVLACVLDELARKKWKNGKGEGL